MNAADRHSAGFVLAGGRSSRMGRDKALLPLRSDVLISHIAGIVCKSAGSVHLVGAPESYQDLGIPMIPDEYPGFGPVGGIATALGASTAEWNLILACDMPEVSVEFLAGLLQSGVESGTMCTMPVTPDGHRHPMCSVYHRSAQDPFRRAVRDGVHRLLTVVEGLNVHFYPAPQPSSLMNVNTPMEWKDYQNAAH